MQVKVLRGAFEKRKAQADQRIWLHDKAEEQSKAMKHAKRIKPFPEQGGGERNNLESVSRDGSSPGM